jgi:hypothetical protein
MNETTGNSEEIDDLEVVWLASALSASERKELRARVRKDLDDLYARLSLLGAGAYGFSGHEGKE